MWSHAMGVGSPNRESYHLGSDFGAPDTRGHFSRRSESFLAHRPLRGGHKIGIIMRFDELMKTYYEVRVISIESVTEPPGA
ncbi:hypothetical protein FHS27_003893 [Rhodopirellula rubra]|uniref:Uncharacterized protein n=1 Tax=Aporhodopirellula rubra TaxID=980271 RepID=A0A7W5E0S9_9BACT|nr:hypothetical protein [Aporhodopirellula rubra]MBB3208066.1 hypothetical protein [Aporhodopirellula rubra]